MEKIEIDMRGLICPTTLISALRQINKHKNEIKAGGLSLIFLTDNRDSTVTIPDSAHNMGYAVNVERCEGFYRIEIQASRDARKIV